MIKISPQALKIFQQIKFLCVSKKRYFSDFCLIYVLEFGFYFFTCISEFRARTYIRKYCLMVISMMQITVGIMAVMNTNCPSNGKQ